jgi:glycerophosphoryl diester phosphodiesterase
MNNSQAIWISHRGLALQYDENTDEAFTAACEARFSWLETDLQSTADDHIVLCHDAQLSSISSSLEQVDQLTRQQLETVQLHKGGHLLFLDQFMAQFSKQNWVFDIKPETAPQTIKNLQKILHNEPLLLKKIIFLFWSKQQQHLFLTEFPQAICFPRIEQCYRAGIAILLGLSGFAQIEKGKIYSLTPKFLGLPLLNRRIVKKFHQQGAKIIAYLPKTEQESQQCLQAGVDFVLSNESFHQ